MVKIRMMQARKQLRPAPKPASNKPKAPKQVKKQRPKMPINGHLGLLADPCGADPNIPPAYSGVPLAYSTRTVDYYNPSAGSPSTGSTASSIAWFSQTANLYVGTASTGLNAVFTPAASIASSYVRSNAKQCRLKAACLEWVPTGPVSGRQGFVGIGYSPSGVLTGGSIVSAPQLMASCEKVGSNGSFRHEVRWLPNLIDEVPIDPTTGFHPAGGQIFIALSGVDATAGAPNGVFKLTCVWEWTPLVTGGLSSAVSTVSREDLQTVLRQAGNLVRFAVGGMPGPAGVLGRAAIQMLSPAGQASAM